MPIASQTFGEGGEILRMPPEVADGITVCYNYLDGEDTSTKQKLFESAFCAKFGYDYESSVILASTNIKASCSEPKQCRKVWNLRFVIREPYYYPWTA